MLSLYGLLLISSRRCLAPRPSIGLMLFPHRSSSHRCTSAATGFGKDLMKEQQAYERPMRSVGGMQAQIEGGVRPAVEQFAQAEVERLRSLSEQQKAILRDCLAHIDQSILNCRAKVDEYRQTRSDLAALNERLANLGAEPMTIPDHFPTENLGDLMLARLQGLRAKDKI